MKLKNLFAITAVVMAGGCFFQTSARANTTSSVGDLILAFRVNDGTGTGGTTDLEIDLGYTAASLVSAAQSAGGTLSLTSLFSAADLRNIFGDGSTNSSWNGRSDLVWSVAGTNGSGGGNSIWVTDPNGVLANVRSANQSGPAGKINTEYGALNNQPATLSSPNGVSVAAAQANSYSAEIRNGNPGTFSKDYNALTRVTESGVVSSGSITASLIELVQGTGAGTNLGTFSLDSSGNLEFIVPIPEPSTYAMFGLGAVGVFFLARRRSLMTA